MTHSFLGNWSKNLTGWRLPEVEANQDPAAHTVFHLQVKKKLKKVARVEDSRSK